MHYVGRFTNCLNKQYVEGETCFVDMIDIGDFNIELVNTVLNCIGYEDDDDMVLHYKIPLKSLNIGLKPLDSVSDISNFLGYVNNHKMVYVYVEKVEKTESSSDEEGEGDSESEDGNDFVDEEHLLDEVEVNMNDLEVLDFDSLESDHDDENARSRGLRMLEARDSPIITALEYVRKYLMKRIVIVQKVIEKSDGPLTPAVTKLFNKIKEVASKCIVDWNGSDLFQVKGPYQDQCVVNLTQKTCSCRKWEISGIPCKHVIATIHDMTDNGMDVGTPEDWVHESYKLQTCMNVYSHKINLVNGRYMWSKFECPTTMLPPKVHPKIGRPSKKRKKSKGEIAIVKGDKLTRKGKTITCNNCKGTGHNKRGCKATGSSDGGQRHHMPSDTVPSQPLGSQQVVSQGMSTQPLSNQAGPSEPVARKRFTKKSIARKAITRKRSASEVIQAAQGSQPATQGSQAARPCSQAARPCSQAAPTSPTMKRTKMSACRLTPDKQ
ncbi:ATP-dependent (S)-NAD(P)H-hydrate dehydratase isoform X3 [Tanacetum coccineum]|uniref:ATP-dependent (S)-NAD(P)H-hydrate dehydratase isoform X3 n=1 Tax=Tanacetum coccineum TaxID=301880 RepID=A0ABQ4Z2G6_9ASTR